MKKTITDVNVENKRVFVRADFNVPLDENCHITDDTRIQKTLPTIKYFGTPRHRRQIRSGLRRRRNESHG